MNEAETKAYGLVAKAIAQFAEDMTTWDRSQAFPKVGRPIFFHQFMSTFEAAATDLCRLHICSPVEKCYFAFDCPVDEADLVAERNSPDGPSLAALLVTFINLFGEYGAEWGISNAPNIVFGENSRIRPTLEALALIGYLTKINEGYAWTKLAIPIMRASYEADKWTGPIRSVDSKRALKTLR